MNQNNIDTVRLLLAIAPAVFASGRFAMKGGTALNLFVQEMPRLRASDSRRDCQNVARNRVRNAKRRPLLSPPFL